VSARGSQACSGQGRSLRERVISEISSLKLSSTEVTPLGKSYVSTIRVSQTHRVALDDVEGKHALCCAPPYVAIFGRDVRGKGAEEPGPALRSVIREQLDAVDAHKGEKRVMPAFEVAGSMALLNRREFSLENRHKEVAGSACGLEKARIDSLGL